MTVASVRHPRRCGGHAGRILVVDLAADKSHTEPLDPDFARAWLGGRGFNIRRLYDEVGPATDPLGPDNTMIFGVGPLNGTTFPGAARFNVTAKSPHTGILGDSNAGGFWGNELKYAGYDQLVLRGRATELSYLLIQDGSVQVLPAERLGLGGLDVVEATEAIRAAHGGGGGGGKGRGSRGDGRLQVACVGPAAERGVVFAGIFCNHARAAARTGMGTVLASKNLKAIAVRGTGAVTVADPAAFAAAVAETDSIIYGHPEYGVRCQLGTTKLVAALDRLGMLATRHFQAGRFEHAREVSGEALARRFKTKWKACHSCTIPCSRFWRLPADGPWGAAAGEGPEFEGLAGFSSRVGNGDLQLALAAHDLCNRLGMDAITTTEMISFTMECRELGLLSPADADGLSLEWGNPATIMGLTRKIAAREGIGDLLARGVRAAAREIDGGGWTRSGRAVGGGAVTGTGAATISSGSHRARDGAGVSAGDIAMHVKGLEVFQADPRGIKGYALGYAVASRGGDHLRSEPWFEFSGDAEAGRRRFGDAESAFRLKHGGKGRLVKHYEELSALADCANACKNTCVNMEVLDFAQAARVLGAATGFNYAPEEIQQRAEAIVNLERAFIVREGVRRADDALPRRFTGEPLPPGSGESTGSTVDLEPMLDQYYAARGWDPATGVPGTAKLRELGLGWAAEELRRHTAGN